MAIHNISTSVLSSNKEGEAVKIHCAYNEIRKIEDISPNPRNPNTHPPKQINLLAKIIQAQGWRAPITVSSRSGLIVRGHARLLAAQKLKLTEVPIDLQDYASDDEEWADLIADNQLSNMSEFDTEALKDILQELEITGIDMELFAFTESELIDLGVGKLEEKDEFDFDAEVKKIKEPATKPGDIWAMGKHRLMCGDSTKPEDVQRLMGEKKAVLFSTDPPYLIGYDGTNRPGGDGKDWSGLFRDKEIKDKEGFLRDTFLTWLPFLRNNAAWFIWFSDSRHELFKKALTDCGILVHEQIIWVKPTFVFGHLVYLFRYEPCFFGWKKKCSPYFKPKFWEEGWSNVWEMDWEGKKKNVGGEHPARKPTELFAIPIRNHTQLGEICAEPFAGSGTQFVAAEQTGRICYGMEIEPVFCDVVVKRWEKFSGQKAKAEAGVKELEKR